MIMNNVVGASEVLAVVAYFKIYLDISLEMRWLTTSSSVAYS
jgi:hypothetical protein